MLGRHKEWVGKSCQVKSSWPFENLDQIRPGTCSLKVDQVLTRRKEKPNIGRFA